MSNKRRVAKKKPAHRQSKHREKYVADKTDIIVDIKSLEVGVERVMKSVREVGLTEEKFNLLSAEKQEEIKKLYQTITPGIANLAKIKDDLLKRAVQVEIPKKRDAHAEFVFRNLLMGLTQETQTLLTSVVAPLVANAEQLFELSKEAVLLEA